MSSPTPESIFKWLPGWVLAGFAFGVASLCGLAWYFKHHSFHGNYVRFYPKAAPETLYQPTLDEMLGIVRGKYREGQVLVLVGGNSIFYGVGQPVDKLWTKHLQEELGDKYCVVNLALRGGPISSGAYVVSEVLRDEIPNQIFVANTSPLSAPSPVGEKAYQYLNQSAWDRGLFEKLPDRDEDFRKAWPEHRYSIDRAYNLADGVFGFRLLGNALAWRVVNTYSYDKAVPFPEWLTPRGKLPDEEPDADLFPMARRYNPAGLDIEMHITRGFSSLSMERGADGKWTPAVVRHEELKRYLRMLRPESLKKKTLIVISSNSPYYLEKLTPDENARDIAATKASVEVWEREGYQVMYYRDGFTQDDFVDRTHLDPSGGAKLANMVAAKVRTLTKELNYE